MNKYFNISDTVYDITEKYPELIQYLVGKGFTPLSNPVMRNLMAKKITLEKALQSKELNIEECEKEMCAIIESGGMDAVENVDASLRRDNVNIADIDDGKKKIRIEGVLPCPIKIPLLEGFEEFYQAYMKEHKDELEKNNYKITYDLRPANLGIDWICEQAKTGKKENLPDVLLSAGFELFFDKGLMGGFIENNEFNCTIEKMNKDFCNDYIDLRDDKNHYAIIGIVPAIMVVNKLALNGRKIPQTWTELLSGEYENSVSIPLQDLDLFNAVILYIYKAFGDKGVYQLAKACKRFLHPAQMVKSNQAEDMPAINVCPYFFSKMLKENSDMEAVWPKDGAITSPIFMLVKKDNAKITKPFVDFFLSEKTGKVFGESGFFPSTNVNVNNGLSSDKKFLWVGWDFLRENDIGPLIQKLRSDFTKIVDSK